MTYDGVPAVCVCERECECWEGSAGRRGAGAGAEGRRGERGEERGGEEDRHKAGVRACEWWYQANKLLQAGDFCSTRFLR